MPARPPVVFLAFANDRVAPARHLGLASERDGIEQALHGLVEHGQLATHAVDSARIADLTTELADREFASRVVVFHYGGHADHATLAFEGENGRADPVRAKSLADYLLQLPGLVLVFLNACATVDLGKYLRQHGTQAVISTVRRVDDVTAAEFARQFYRHLVGRTIEDAFESAKNATRLTVGGHEAGARDFAAVGGVVVGDEFPWMLHLAPDAKGWRLPAEVPCSGRVAIAPAFGSIATLLVLVAAVIVAFVLASIPAGTDVPVEPAVEETAARRDASPGLGDVPPMPTPPPGMVYVKGGRLPHEISSAQDHFDDCRNAYGDACRWTTFERETRRTAPTDVADFFIDTHEVTNAELAPFIAALRASGDAIVAGDKGLFAAGMPVDRLLVKFSFSAEARFDPPYVAFTGDARTLAPAPGMADRPAVLLTWELASRYCEAKGKRLPTEAEWEHAARGPDGREYVWGDEMPRCREAAYGRLPLEHDNGYVECRNEARQPDPVGASRVDRSWCGAADMGANVSEWVADSFVDAGVDCPAGNRMDETGKTLCHLYKGGNWIDPLRFARTTYRPVGGPGRVFASVGFRCAAAVETTR